jgi:hypothetical protein
MLHRYSRQGLRLIEVDRADLIDLPAIAEMREVMPLTADVTPLMPDMNAALFSQMLTLKCSAIAYLLHPLRHCLSVRHGGCPVGDKDGVLNL